MIPFHVSRSADPDLLTNEQDLLEMYCDCIVKNKSIGIYDGGYKCVELATGKKFERK